MSKPIFNKPFGAKKDKAPNRDSLEKKQYDLKQPQSTPAQNPTFTLNKNKINDNLQQKKKNAYDALSQLNSQPKAEEEPKKITMTRPNLGLKRPVPPSGVIKPPSSPQAVEQAPTEPLVEPAPAPMELPKKNYELKTPFQLKKKTVEREKVILAEQQPAERVPDIPKISQPSNELRVPEGGTEIAKPNLRPKRPQIRKTQNTTNNDANFEESSFNPIPQEEVSSSLMNSKPAMPSREEPTQRSTAPVMNDYKINLAELELRDINIDGTKQVSQGKLERQKERATQLSKLLNLEMDSYEQTLNLSSITEYELYINKIKSGFINNSLDQAFDETADGWSQTPRMDFVDSSQQCPDDRTRAWGDKRDTTGSLFSFLSKAATVMQELIRPSKVFVMPPIYLLSLNPQLLSVHYNPYPTYLYRTNDLSIAAIGQKLYVARGEVTTTLGIGKFLLGGTKEGAIYLWAGHSQRGTFYQTVYTMLNNSDFQLPSYSTDVLEKQSYFKSTSQIVKLVQKSQNEFWSIQQFGKIVQWLIMTEENAYGQLAYRLKPVSFISLTSLYCDPNILCFDMEVDAEGSLYVSTSKGIVRADEQRGSPQTYSTQCRCTRLYLSKRGNLMYALCQDNSLKVFDKSISNCLISVQIDSKGEPADILIPKIEIQGRQLELLYQVYVADTHARVYRFNLLDDRSMPQETIAKDGSSDKNLFKSCVALQDSELQFLFVTRDLRTTHLTEASKVNLQKNNQNIKKVIECNKRFKEQLEELVAI